MTLEEIYAEVDKRCAEKLMPFLIDKGINLHKKHEWRTCSCSHCDIKREATSNISYISRRSFNQPGIVKFVDPNTFEPMISITEGDETITMDIVEAYKYFRMKNYQKYHARMQHEIHKSIC